MKYRVLIILMLVLTALPVMPGISGAAVYEASTLHNAVARSETVMDLFFERWERIQNMELYFDWFGKINWVQGFRAVTKTQVMLAKRLAMRHKES